MAVDPHCFDADPELKILMRIRIQIQIQEGGGGRSAKNVHPPWQNPRYAPEAWSSLNFQFSLNTSL